MRKKIKSIITILLLIATLCISFSVNANTMLTSKSFKFEHDKSLLSRISPKTTITELKSDINAEDESKLIVYKDDTLKTEVSSGYVKTGMALKYEDKVYTLVVAGDVDKDGEATQVDLTRVIRYIVDLSGSELTGIYYEAADLTGDGLVDQRDLTKYIRYIVLGELNLGEVDTTAPVITLNASDITSYSMKIEADATDSGIGMGSKPTYTFCVKKASQEDTTYVEKQSGTDKVLDLSGLEQNTEYEIKVITHDNSGNEAVETIKVTTMKIPDGIDTGALSISSPIWNSGKAEVKITTNTTYQIEYQVNGTSGTWKKATTAGEPITVTGLKHNDVIYARLTDGISSGDYITATIIDDIKPQLTLSASSDVSNIKVVATAKDNETGISASANYVFSIKEAGADEVTYVEIQNTTSKECDFTGLEQEKEYEIKVEVEDIAGNKAEETIKVATTKIPDASEVGILNIGTPIWNSGKAEVTISTTTSFKIEYQVNGTTGTWTTATTAGTPITATGLKHNDVVYVRLTNGVSAGEYTTVTILDTIKPQVDMNLSPSTSEIEASVTAQDFESGIASDATYKFSIKKTSEPDTSYVEVQNTTDLTCKLTGLDADESYTIKVEVTDIAGNVTTKEMTQVTKQLPSATEPGAIIFENITWTSGKAGVTIKTNTSFQIEYQINGTGSVWTKASSPVDVTSLNHNDVIYARLTDGTSSGSYTTVTIVDSIIPKISLDLQAKNQTIDALVTAEDFETGIDSVATYKFSIKDTGEDDSTYVETQNTTSTTCTFTSLEVGKNYTVKVEVEDIAGNKAMIEKSILIPDDVAPVVTLNIISRTSSTATAEAGATDVGGLPTPTIYKFYIKETGASDSTYVEVQNSSSNVCTFDKLTQGKDYTLKVTVEDEAGNVGVKEVSLTTDKIPAGTDVGAIIFDSITWASGNASVKIKTNTSYYIEYQVNGTTGTWTRATTAGIEVIATGLKHNDIIYARLTDGINTSDPATVTVVDTVKPNVTLSLSSETSKITATANATDNESGIDTAATYIFYLKEGTSSYVRVQANTSKICEFTGLTHNTSYTIKVEVEDIAGNVGTKEQTISTKAIPDATTTGAINFSEPIWTSGTAEVTISTTTSFAIEYQINKTTGTWVKGITVTGLNHNDVIYARLTDGTSAGTYTSITVKDTIAPESFTITVSDITYESLTIAGSTIDNESGIKNYRYVVATEEAEILNITTTQTSYDVEGLTEETTYTIYMIAYDNAENERKSNELTIKTEAEPVARMFGQYVDYEVDIDDNEDDYDWQIFYIEEDETSPNYGATYLIADYYVPASKMTTSLSNVGMKLYTSPYCVNWSSLKASSYLTIPDEIKSIFMYDYTGTSNDNMKMVSRLLNTAAWQNDFVTERLQAVGGMAIGGPTINMWVASWNKAYPAENLSYKIGSKGYLINGKVSVQLTNYCGYKNDAPNVYFPTKSVDKTCYGYMISGPDNSGGTALMVICGPNQSHISSGRRRLL